VGKARLRRWLVPGAAAGTIVVPLLVGGCFDDADPPFWYGLPGCEACSDCYDELAGTPPGDGMPPELRFTGEPPEGDPHDRQPTSQTEDDQDARPAGRRLPDASSRIPDGVLRPRPDRPSLPETPVQHSHPPGSPPSSAKKY
jgi:hypothetical protein